MGWWCRHHARGSATHATVTRPGDARAYPTATTSAACPMATNPGASPTTMNRRDWCPQWAGAFGACDAAKTSPGIANDTGSWGSQKHLGCWCGSPAARRIGRWQQSLRCPSHRWPAFLCLFLRCPSPWGMPGWLSRRGVNQSSRCRGGNGCCIWVRVGFLSCSFSLFHSMYLRYWLLHASRGFRLAQGLFHLWDLYWLYLIHSIMGHRACSVFATPGV